MDKCHIVEMARLNRREVSGDYFQYDITYTVYLVYVSWLFASVHGYIPARTSHIPTVKWRDT